MIVGDLKITDVKIGFLEEGGEKGGITAVELEITVATIDEEK